jgi:mannosyl-oligosaccharide alpha-1,2-mannosidase
VPNREAAIKIPQLKTSDGVKGGYSLPTKAPATVPDRKPPAIHGAYGEVNENAAVHFGEPVPTSTTPHWQKQPDWFPVPDESIIPLPTGKPKHIPSVQFAFGDESPAAKEKRELRMAKVKAETQRAWDGYKKYAWTHDELMPVAKMFKDPFCGWAATLVDSLDTLWLMGMKAEFDEAVEAVKAIDFTTTHRDNIPVFETVIRYLGGLIGAYDVTGGHKGKYRVLLDKAVELAEILMSVFDTPNRMPILYYDWKPAGNIQPKRASTSSGVAELGSLSMEFTRLAQLTGENKYYDAVARITDALEDLQNRENATALPGIFPEHIDASGCNRSASLPSAPEPPTKTPGSSTAREFPPEWECAPQGLVRGGWGGGGTYSMGGSQDSTYEYFPKQYALLGGLEAKYRTMHEKVADAVKKYLLYRPMAEGNPDILFSAKAHSSDGTDQRLSYEWEVTHLTCFLGGMFGLGGKIFNRPEDVEVGKKLADGCVWAYEIMPTGIMPESASLTPCKIPDDCPWNKTAWYERLDPSAEYRAKAMENYHVSKAEWEREVQDLKKKDVLRKQTEERKRREAAAGKVAEEEERQKRPVNNTLPGEEESTAPQPDQPSQDSSRGLKRRDALPQSEIQTRDSEDGYGDTWDQEQMDELVLPYEPVKPQTHEEYVADYIERHQIPPGFTAVNDKRYILR